MSLFEKILFFLFPKRKILFLGRAGLIYKFNSQYFFVDSEMLSGGKYDIAIYVASIRYENKNLKELSESQKQEVLNLLIVELSAMGLNPDLIGNLS